MIGKDKAWVEHTFEPVFNQDSKILLLGTLPSVKSRETNFYYGHKQNRFWKLIASLTKEALPETNSQKKQLLLRHGIAIWDVVASCDIEGSSDSSIRNVKANDLSIILNSSNIAFIGGNGDMACRLYQKYCQQSILRDIVKLPSTSPANAACSMEQLTQIWGEQLAPFLEESV